MDKRLLKEKAVRVASAFFTERGIRSVKMDDIAMELSISKRTLYELFSDKEELLLEVVKSHREEMKAFMTKEAERAGNVLEIIMAFYRKISQDFKNANGNFFEDIKKYPRVTEMLEKGRKDNIEGAMKFYAKGVEQGIFRKDVNYRIVQEMMHGQMDTLIQSKSCQQYTMLELFETLMFMHLRGISTEAGLKHVDDFICRMRSEKEQEM